MLVSFSNAIKSPTRALQPFIGREETREVISKLQEDLNKKFKGEVAVFLEDSNYFPRIIVEGTIYAEDVGYSSISTETASHMLEDILRKHLEYDFLDIFPRYDLRVYDKDNVKITALDIPDRLNTINP